MTKQIYIPTEEELIEIGFSYSMSCDCKAKEVKSGIFITYDCGFGIDIDSIFGEPYGGYTEVYPRSKEALIDFISNFSQNE